MRRLWTGMGQAGSGVIPSAPPGFEYPTKESFVAGLTSALGEVDEDWASKNLSKPVAAAVPLIKTTISAAGDMNFNQLASAARSGTLGGGQIAAITSALGSLVQGALSIAQQLSESSATGQAIASAADAIPVIGGIIQWVVDLVLGIAGSSAMYDRLGTEAEQKLHEELAEMCRGWADADRPYGPGPKLTPADIFRKIGFRYQKWVKDGRPAVAPRLPLNASSMYVMLCGGETQGFGLSRSRYDQLVAKARKRNPKIGGGIPRSVQRKMWGFIKGIMANVSDPIGEPPVGDEGRMLMAMLQDVCREYYIRVQKHGGPGWDTYLAQLLSDEVTGDYLHKVWSYPTGELGERLGPGVVQRTASCAGQKHGYGRHLDLSQTLIDSISKYQGALFAEFWDPVKQDWRVSPRTKVMTTKVGELVLSKRGSEQVAGAIERATGRSRPWVVPVASLASAGVGYLAGRFGMQAFKRLG